MKKHKPVIEKINVKEGKFLGTRIWSPVLIYSYENPSGYITEMVRESRNITCSGTNFTIKLVVYI